MAHIPTFKLSLVKERREMLGLTHQKMATKLNFKNASTYFKYENGTYIFKAVHLPTLAYELQCNMEDFFTFE